MNPWEQIQKTTKIMPSCNSNTSLAWPKATTPVLSRPTVSRLLVTMRAVDFLRDVWPVYTGAGLIVFDQ